MLSLITILIHILAKIIVQRKHFLMILITNGNFFQLPTILSKKCAKKCCNFDESRVLCTYEINVNKKFTIYSQISHNLFADLEVDRNGGGVVWHSLITKRLIKAVKPEKVQ